MVLEQPGNVATIVCVSPSEGRLLKTAANVVLLAAVANVRLCAPLLTVNVPVVEFVNVTRAVTEYVLVAVAQAPTVAVAVSEQTGSAGQAAGASYVTLMLCP